MVLTAACVRALFILFTHWIAVWRPTSIGRRRRHFCLSYALRLRAFSRSLSLRAFPCHAMPNGRVAKVTLPSPAQYAAEKYVGYICFFIRNLPLTSRSYQSQSERLRACGRTNSNAYATHRIRCDDASHSMTFDFAHRGTVGISGTHANGHEWRCIEEK